MAAKNKASLSLGGVLLLILGVLGQHFLGGAKPAVGASDGGGAAVSAEADRSADSGAAASSAKPGTSAPESATRPGAAPDARGPDGQTNSGNSGDSGAAAPTPAKKASAARASVGFRSRTQWLDHFDKHGAEFKVKTAEEYLALAQDLRDRPLSSTLVEALRSDGVVTRFDRKSGAFGAFNSDGTIRTFFKPNDGEQYFKRQIEKDH